VLNLNANNNLEKEFNMTMKNTFANFCNDESGAVTVDWVVLTAAIVGLGVVIMNLVGGGIEDLGDRVVTDLSTSEFKYVGRP
jgi:Flp pilus assembly pilin Flp